MNDIPIEDTCSDLDVTDVLYDLVGNTITGEEYTFSDEYGQPWAVMLGWGRYEQLLTCENTLSVIRSYVGPCLDDAYAT